MHTLKMKHIYLSLFFLMYLNACVQKSTPGNYTIDGLIDTINDAEIKAKDQNIKDLALAIDQQIQDLGGQPAGMVGGMIGGQPAGMIGGQPAGMIGGQPAGQVTDMSVVDQMKDMMQVNQGPTCDPRLYAQQCDVGFRCIPKVGGREFEGFCVEGDHCIPGVSENNGCPANLPYCHLDGKATRCTEVGTLREGEPCRLNQENLPCALGLVCNAGYCAKSCYPSSPSTGCDTDQRCVNIEEEVGVAGGYCFSSNCNFFNDDGCANGDKCNLAFGSRGELKGFCSYEGEAQLNESCINYTAEEGGGDDCAPGLLCVTTGNGSQSCRQLCDKGFYETSCPANQTCREVLRRSGNVIVYGVGICYANP
jgi:hypothetical protein